MFAKVLLAVKKFIQSIFAQKATSVPTASIETTQPVTITTQPMEKTTSEKIYDNAKFYLEQHLSLNEAVPALLGCAQAVSFILLHSGLLNFPIRGFDSTTDLHNWLVKNATQVTDPMPGDVIISPTGESTKESPHGHTGIIAKFGICSNDSDTGLWKENFTLEHWKDHYSAQLGFPVLFYRL